MSQENVEIALESIEAFNRQDVAAFVGTLSSDVEWNDAMFYSETPRIYRGRDEVRDWFHRVMEPWESIHAEANEIREARDGRTLLGGVMTARGKGSGAETKLIGWFVFWFADGKITRRKAFLDRGEALEAAGLPE